MTPEQVIKYFGNDVKVAAALGLSQRCVQLWVKKGEISWLNQCAIAYISGGKLKVAQKSL